MVIVRQRVHGEMRERKNGKRKRLEVLGWRRQEENGKRGWRETNGEREKIPHRLSFAMRLLSFNEFIARKATPTRCCAKLLRATKNTTNLHAYAMGPDVNTLKHQEIIKTHIFKNNFAKKKRQFLLRGACHAFVRQGVHVRVANGCYQATDRKERRRESVFL